jgi:hypothetical protein
MKHPGYYRGIKRKVVRFLFRHSLLTTRQWHEVLLSVDRPPRNHEQFFATCHPSEPELSMTRQQLEEMITRSPTWRDHMSMLRASSAAFALASVGEIGGPESSLGATREAALQILRRRLDALGVAKIEIILQHYDASGPHPQHVFGPGWSEADQRKQAAKRVECQREEGVETEEEWLAKYRAHWYHRLADRLRYLRRFAFALSLPRRYRELRYRPHRPGRRGVTI